MLCTWCGARRTHARTVTFRVSAPCCCAPGEEGRRISHTSPSANHLGTATTIRVLVGSLSRYSDTEKSSGGELKSGFQPSPSLLPVTYASSSGTAPQGFDDSMSTRLPVWRYSTTAEVTTTSQGEPLSFGSAPGFGGGGPSSVVLTAVLLPKLPGCPPQFCSANGVSRGAVVTLRKFLP